MQKTYFHNIQETNENEVKKKKLQSTNIKKKSVVDINILLNKVKINNQKEIKKKIIVYSILLLILSVFIFFVIKN
tara:strand:- start:3345 stop:3569 length:225 start_codon:yes stop_codon:yes gene_type:complete